ncbi:MAG: sigma-54 dependent transcriptional regulator [Bacteroidales bacterium]|nr:sigma-54 dependent transcriptional regulator [Bacteroidales bacterium]
MNKMILIVDDDINLCVMLQKWLVKNGYDAIYASSIEGAKKMIEEGHPNLLISDLRLPDGDGIMLLHWINDNKLALPVILMTGYGEVSIAVSAMKLGAKDFLEKPVVPSLLKEKIDNILNSIGGEKDREKSNNTKGRSQQKDYKREVTDMIIGKSPAFLTMLDFIKTVAPTNFTVLVLGESGTGKEYAAKLIHQYSKRCNNPFIALDCGSLSKELAPSELFGHLKGSFTSAISDKKGVFELADGGTVFLDEIGNLSYDVQVQLLRALQEQKIRPVGSAKDIKVDVRIIAATNENLEIAIEQGRFREDLYHRLNEFSLEVPPLRERKEDIEVFAYGFLKSANEELEKNVTSISSEALELLKQYRWSGNLRELRNVIRRAVLFAGGNEITAKDIPGIRPIAPVTKDYALRPGDEKSQIEEVLYKARGNKTLAAQLLKIDRKTLYNKMHQYGIEL